MTRTETPTTDRADELLALFGPMVRIRAFEERVASNFRTGNVHGFVHVSIGQESIAAGTCAGLRPDDYISTTHRGHGHCLAKGADPVAMMAELFGRATGLCHGKGGSMHLADPSLGILGANGVVGAGIPLATGAALAAQVRRSGQVAVAFFGEGALHTGAFHEASSLAVAWRLPLLLVCERNGWAEFTPTDQWGGPEPAERGGSYGMVSRAIKGADVLAVRDTVAELIGPVRAGEGPAFLEVATVRRHGHYEGDAQPYREEEDEAEISLHDPITVARNALAEQGVDIDAIEHSAEEEMDSAVAAALEAPYPEEDSVLEHVYA